MSHETAPQMVKDALRNSEDVPTCWIRGSDGRWPGGDDRNGFDYGLSIIKDSTPPTSTVHEGRYAHLSLDEQLADLEETPCSINVPPYRRLRVSLL
jgi:hypothetical protein